jgi:hypothetical protein
MSKHVSSKQPESPAAGTDPVTAVQAVARALPAVEPVTIAAREEMRSAVRRAPAAFIALVLSEAEESGGNVAGVPIDATAARDAQAQASRLRVGAAAARAVARHLEQESLTLASGVAMQALAATSSLEALARTPSGRNLVAKATALRSAARGTKRRASGAKTAKGATASSTGSAHATSSTAPAAHDATPAPDATANGAATNGTTRSA